MDNAEVEPETHDREDPPAAPVATSFTPAEVRDTCAAVRQNARDFTMFHIRTVLARRWQSLDQTFAGLEETYQYDSTLVLSDGDRKALAGTLWITKAFVERAAPLRALVDRANPSGIPDFDRVAEQWCQGSMRGSQSPIAFMGDTVPYMPIQRT